MIEKIMSKLGMVVLWCIVIIYDIGVITHICSDIFGVVVLVILAVISIIFVLYAKRYKIWFKRQVKLYMKRPQFLFVTCLIISRYTKIQT